MKIAKKTGYSFCLLTGFIFFSLVVLSDLTAMGFNSPPCAEFVPQWKAGDRWVVKTESAGENIGGPSQSQSKKLPVQNLWMYKVVSVKDEVVNGEDIRFFHIMASSWRSERKELGGFLFAGKLNATRTIVVSLSLLQSGWKNGEAGISIQRDYSKMAKTPFPIINDYSPIPSSFPIFIGNSIIGGKAGVTFEVTHKIGVLPFAKDVKQTVVKAGELDSLMVKLTLSGKEKLNICEVVISRFDDNYRVRQLWSKKYPWFLYSDNGDFRAWLVKYKRAEK
jgi:hypothetical protein